jgi:hypothetical protein
MRKWRGGTAQVCVDVRSDGEVGWGKWPRSMVLGPRECAQPCLCGTVAHDCMVKRCHLPPVSPSEVHYKVGDLFSSAASLELQNAADGSIICFSSPFNRMGIGYMEGRRGGDSIQAGSTFQRTRVSGWGWRGEGGYVSIKTGPAPKGGKRWTGARAELLEAEVGLRGILIAAFVLVQAGESDHRE